MSYRVMASHVFELTFVIVDETTEMLARPKPHAQPYRFDNFAEAMAKAARLTSDQERVLKKALKAKAADEACAGSGMRWTTSRECALCGASAASLGVKRIRAVSVVPQHPAR